MIDKIKEKLVLLSIGTVVTAITYLTSSYFSGFVTRAEYNEDKVDVAVIKNDLKHLREGQEEIKKLLVK